MKTKKSESVQQVELKSELRVQFEQSLAEIIVAHRRIEYIAFRVLEEDEYKKMCVNVADFCKKICSNEKK